MSFDMAKKLLKPRLETEDKEPLLIEILGAEPLTAFKRLKEIVEWVKSMSFKRCFRFFSTTNGTLLDEKMKRWFYENREIIVLCLSYDGTEAAHNINRSNSSSRIDLQFFLKAWPMQAVKYTISEETVFDLAKGIVRLSDMGYRIHANPAYEEREWNAQSISEYGRQLRKIADYYIEHPDKPVASLVNHNLIDIYEHRETPQGPQCGAKYGYGIYDVDGQSYPCHMLSPVVIDKKKAKNAQHLILKTQISYQDKMCSDCVIKNACPTCMAMNYLERGDFAKRDLTHCRLTKMEVLATCLLYSRRLLQHKEHTRQDAVLAKAIHYIYRSLINL